MTRSTVPPPPSSLPALHFKTIAAGMMLHRTHVASFASAQFNPCRGAPSRFAPIEDRATGVCIPSLYAASSRDAAIFETIFHDIAAKAPFKTVPLERVQQRLVSSIRPKRDCKLVGLFTPDLKAWGLERRQLIDTPKSTYRRTAAWAAAIHDLVADADGLVWTSRQCDPELCVVFFGNRVAADDFEIEDCRLVADDASLLQAIRELGQRAGISLVT